MENQIENQAIELVSEREQVPKGGKGRIRIQRDWEDVPSQTDQSQRDENNINVLVERYKPDELAHYLAMKNGQRQQIENHDFSLEPTLQDAMTSAYQITEQFKTLPEDIQKYFDRRPAEFLKFCENPKNLPQLKLWGLAKDKKPEPEQQNNKPNENTAPVPTPVPPVPS